MHYLAGVLLLTEFTLLWLLDKVVFFNGLDYVAWVIWFFAMILLFLPISALRKKGGVGEKESYTKTSVLVTSGIYAIVRHPQYLGWLLMYLAVILFNPRWLLTIVGILGVSCVLIFAKQEDEILLKKFGQPYEDYMQSVPGMNLLTGLIRLWRH